MGNQTSSPNYSYQSGLLFTQLPHDINLIILNLLDVGTLIKVSATSKRWLDNTKYLENLSLCLTKQPITEYISDKYSKRRRTKLAKLNWNPIEVKLNRFDPERLRVLSLEPNFRQQNDLITNFISRATRLTKLVVNSEHLLPGILSLPPNNMKELIFSSNFDGRCAQHFLNLEKVTCCVQHLNYQLVDFSALSNLRKLKHLYIQHVSSPYVDVHQIGQLTGLTELSLYSACLSDEQFGQLATLTNLEKLSLSFLRKELPIDNCTMDDSDIIFPEVGNPNPLRGLRHLTNLAKLTYLDISYLQSKLFGPDQDGGEGAQQQDQEYDVARLVSRHFTNLREINISCTDVGEDSRVKLKQISSLTVIDEKDPLGVKHYF